jgi:hypothetical protein
MNTIDQRENEIDQSKEAVQHDARGLWQSLKAFFLELFDLRADSLMVN